MHTHARMHARTHACTHARTHARMHTHTHTQFYLSVTFWANKCVHIRVSCNVAIKSWDLCNVFLLPSETCWRQGPLDCHSRHCTTTNNNNIHAQLQTSYMSDITIKLNKLKLQ